MKQIVSGWRVSWSAHRWACIIGEESAPESERSGLPYKTSKYPVLAATGSANRGVWRDSLAGKLKGHDWKLGHFSMVRVVDSFYVCSLPCLSVDWRIKWVWQGYSTTNSEQYHKYGELKGIWKKVKSPKAPTVANPFLLPVDINVFAKDTCALKFSQ